MELGLMKQIVKILIKDEDYFAYVCATFLGLSNKKKKNTAGVFNGPQFNN